MAKVEFIEAEQDEAYRASHAKALIAEHEYLLSVAERLDFSFQNILPLVRMNPHVGNLDQMKDVVLVLDNSPMAMYNVHDLSRAQDFYRVMKGQQVHP